MFILIRGSFGFRNEMFGLVTEVNYLYWENKYK